MSALGCDKLMIPLVKKFLLKKLTSKCELRGFKEEHQQIYNIVLRTVRFGESDSVLLIGPPGSGKTTLVRSVIETLKSNEGEYFVVELNGLIHTDDNLALQEIIRVLHVEELEGDSVAGNFSDNLMFVLQSFKSGNKNVSKPIIFLLEEFQMFCTHKNQTLLYNLFDVAQTAQAPICVIGVTSRIDITELLEKRVKSRFSHRLVFLYPNKSLKERLNLIKGYLSLPDNSLEISTTFVKKWNKNIDSLFDDKKAVDLVKRQLNVSTNERDLKLSLVLIVSQLSNKKAIISVSDVEEVFQSYHADPKVETLKDLSVTEFCLIIAMNQQTEIYDGEPFNFEMIANRYFKFANQNNIGQVAQRPLILKGFERIKNLELILPIGGGCRNSKKEYQLYSFMLTNNQVKEAINQYPGLPTDVTQWASSNLV